MKIGKVRLVLLKLSFRYSIMEDVKETTTTLYLKKIVKQDAIDMMPVNSIQTFIKNIFELINDRIFNVGSQATCQLPFEIGPCKGSLKRYFYDKVLI